MTAYLNRQSIQRANARLIAEGRLPGSTGHTGGSLEQARRLLRTHSRMSIAEAGRLAMSLVGSAR